MKKLINIKHSNLGEEHLIRIHEFWNEEYPTVIHHENLEDTLSYLNSLEDVMHTFCLVDHEIAGWMADFVRDSEKFFVMIVSADFQGKGIGTTLLEEAKSRNTQLSGWIILHGKYHLSNGKEYVSPAAFYDKNGFKIYPEISFKSETLSTIKIGWNSGEF